MTERMAMAVIMPIARDVVVGRLVLSVVVVVLLLGSPLVTVAMAHVRVLRRSLARTMTMTISSCMTLARPMVEAMSWGLAVRLAMACDAARYDNDFY